jgi:uncharacterized protein with GYD domain
MALYMTQFSYTKEATAAMAKNPEDRRIAVKKALDALGGRMIGLYFTFGEFDGICIAEVPDKVTELAFLMAVNAAGHVKKTKTTVLLTMEESMTAMKKAGEIAYKGPKG